MPKLVKQRFTKAASGRVQVEWGAGADKYAVPEPGKMSILQKLSPFLQKDGTLLHEALRRAKYDAATLSRYEELAAKYRGGERWASVNEYPEFSNIKDVARLAESGLPIPGDVLKRGNIPDKFLADIEKYYTKPKKPGSLLSGEGGEFQLDPTIAQDLYKRAKSAFENYFSREKNPHGRRLVNVLGTPEVVLKGRGIVEPFQKNKLLLQERRGQIADRLRSIFDDVPEDSPKDFAIGKDLDNPALEGKLTGKADDVRQIYDEVLDEVNKHRIARGQPIVKRRTGYLTHLAKYVKQLDTTFKDLPVPKELRFAFEKRGGEGYSYSLSARKAISAYVDAALRDIYYGDALYEVVPKLEQLSATGKKPIILRQVIKDPKTGKKQMRHVVSLDNAPFGSERGYAEEFIKRQLGWPTRSEKAIANAIPFLTPHNQRVASQTVTKLFYSSLLGAAVDTGVKNLTQGINFAAEKGAMPSLRGYATLATRKGFTAARHEHLLEEFEPLLAAGTEGKFFTKNIPGMTGKVLQAIDDYILGGPMRATEFVNRGVAYHVGLEEALQRGLSLEEAVQSAHKFVRKTQFAYGPMDTSPYLQSALGRPFFQFTSFPIKQSELVAQWATTKGERHKLFRYFALTGALIGGGTYAGVDLSGVFLNPIKMVDPDSNEGFKLPGSDKRATFSLSKLAESGFVPQGPAPVISAPKSIIGGALSDDVYKQERAKKDAVKMLIPGGRYGAKVAEVISELTGEPRRDARNRIIERPNAKSAILKLVGLRPTDAEVDRTMRQEIRDEELYYYNSRKKLIDAMIAGDEKTVNGIFEDWAENHQAALLWFTDHGDEFDQSLEDEAIKKEMTSKERFMDSEFRQLIYAVKRGTK
jgi:hypothetical protein